MNKNYSCKGSFLPYRQVNVFFSGTAARIKKAFLVSLLLMASFWTNLYADGSKDLYPSGVTGNRAFLYSNSYAGGVGSTNTSWPFKTLGTHYVYANVGETIAAASSAQNVGSGRIRLIAPNGAEYITTASATGQIPNRNGELAGPQYPGQGAGGNRYLPYTVTVGAGQAGIWKVEFLPTGSETSSNTPTVTDIAADAAWTQGTSTELICAWDVSVRNTANSAWISGRVYSNVFNLHIQGTSFLDTKAFYGKFFVLTRDGVAYKVTNNGSNGVGFTFFVNNKGFLDTSGNPSYKSLNLSSPSSTDFRVHDPRALDDTNNVTHKIFYTTPALDLPSSATQAISTSSSVLTWLKNNTVTPTATNITYTGVEGTPNLSGNKGAYIGFDSNLAGSYRIEVIGDFPTRTITGNCIVGTNTVFWDGKDGAGNVLAPNTNIGEIRVQLFGAEVHFPFIDMEINPGGIIIEQLDENYALYSPNRDLVYWDDSNVAGGNANTKSNPTASGNLGISSNSNGHKWGRNTSGSSGSGNTGDGGSSFGNEKSLDTWSFVPGAIIIKTLNIIIASADLEVESIAPSATTIGIGQTINYEVVVKNNGPSDVAGAGFAFNVPSGFTITSVTYVNSQGTVVVVNGTIDPATGNYTADLDMTNGSEIVFTITGTVGASLAGQPLNVEGSIIRPADVTDIDATNPGVTPPTDPHLECLNGTAVENCNNIAYNNLNVAAISDLSVVKTANATIPNIGQQVIFTIAVTNNGPNVATGVTVTDQLPSGFTYVSSTVTAGSYNNTTGIWTIGSIPNGTTRTMTVTATVNATGNYTNVATVTGTETDPVPGDNTDNITVAPNANANLEIVKTVNDSTPNVGDQVQFSLLVTNNGTGDATNVLVTDQLSMGYTYVSHTAGANYVPATGIWTVGNLANGASQTLVITATVNATGNHTNTASVDGDENDPDTTDNTDSITTAPNNVVVANNDMTATPVNGFAGGTAIPNVLTNDTLNGAAVVPSAVNISVLPGAVPAGIAFNTTTGTVTVNAGTPSGTYAFDYTICEVTNPTNCDTATVTVNVAPAPINAVNDNPAPVNGYNGDTDVVNILTNDTLNGVPVIPNQVAITIMTPSTNPGVELDPLTGTVSVDPQTPAGTYTIVYQLCEILNPANCDSATVTVVVEAAPINAVNDTNATPVNGYVGGNAIPNVLTNDTLNGAAVVPSEVAISVVPGSVPAGITFNPTTGAVDVTAGTAAGNYTFNYTICEILNPANCDSATVTVVVEAAPINAVNDTNATPVNGYVGGNAIPNVLTNDTLNGAVVVPSEVAISVAPGSVPVGITFNTTTGAVDVAAGTAAGNYTFNYTICEILNPTNCDTAAITVVVAAPPIAANNDTPATPVNGYVGDTDVVNVLNNDTLNGIPVIPNQVAITVTTPSTNPGVELDPLTGTVSVDAQTPAGTYTIVYQLCEVLNPANCDSATVTIVVEEAPIDAVNDNPAPVNGYEGDPDVANVLTNETLNGVPVIPNQVAITVTTPSTNPGVELDPSTGTVSVDPQTPAGTYTIVYQLCEILNPANCDSATVTVVVEEAPIDAVNDNPAPVNGYEGDPDVANVLTNDTLNGVPVIPSEVVVTVTTPSTNPGVELDPSTGTVSVDPQTLAGTYTIVYQLCEVLNPANCDSATVTIVVEEAPIDAVNDNPAPVNGYEGDPDVANVLDNDTLNGVPVIPNQVAITVTTPSTNPGVELDPLTGTVSVDPQTPAGTYTIVYQLCEVLNPANCDSAMVTVVVEPAPIDAVNDNPAPVNGYEGDPDVANVLDNDTLNGIPVIPSQVVVTVTTPSTNPGVELDPSTGTVSVDPQTPAGTYTIVYQLCEILNPANCDSATVTVVVEPAPIDAVNDNPAPVNGYEGNPDVASVLDNDTLNGVPVIPSEVVVTVTTPSTNPGVELDPLTGTVSVDPQTPAGTYTIVYQLCEILNPANCDSATVTVVVEPAPIDAVNDNPAPVNGYEGNPDVANVLDNDTLNGVPVIPSQVVVTVTTPSTNPGVELDPLTGIVSVDPQTPAGTYTIVYQLCEVLNPANCESATVTVVVEPAPIDAVNDNLSTAIVNGNEGQANVGNVFTNDTLNGVAVIPSEVTLTTVNADAPLTLNPDGTISVASGTPAGTYTLEYSICEILNPTNCDTAIVTILVQVPSVEITKQGTFNDANADGFAQVGETITYNFSVANTGTMQLTNITVTDPLVTVTGGPLATLNAGATDTTTFTAIYTFTQADVDAGFVNNQALVSATPIVGQPITDLSDSNDPTLPGNDDQTVTTLPQNPSFELLKEGTYQDANNDGIVNAGDVIEYEFTVTNTGNVTITNIVVTDPIVTVSGGPIASLAPQASDATTFTATYTIAQADIELGAVYNLALAEGTDSNGNPIDDESQDPSPVSPNDPLYEPTCPDCTVTILEQNPSIALIKTATFNDANNNGIAEAGETITYNFTVTNTGNVSLSDVTINDPLPGVVVSGGPINLAVGQSDSTTFTATYAITQADINAGSVSNQAIVTGRSPLGEETTDESDDTDNAGNNPTVVEIDGCTINVFNAVSPNNDGSNEILYIGGLECYPDNKVEIFNRWGVLVYEANGYNNNDKAFRGYSEGRVTVNKSEGLPDGTYFYFLKYKKPDGSVSEKSGYLYLSR